MEINHLRTFVTVAEEQNLTKAATRLFMTPPSVSAHIKALEEELNVLLFVRKPQGMQLTPEGEALKLKAVGALQAVQDVVSHSLWLQSHLTGRIRIGLNATSTFLRIAALIGQMQKAHSEVELSFVSTSTGKILGELKDGTLDAGYIFSPSPDESIIATPLSFAELVVAAPAAWQKQIRNAEWKDIALLPWVSSAIYCPFQVILDQLFAERQLTYRQVAQSDEEATKCELVSLGVGMALLEKGEAAQAASEGKITIWPSEAIQCQLSWAHMSTRKNDPLIAALSKEVKTFWGVP